MNAVLIILSAILSFYALSFVFQILRFLLRRRASSRSSSVVFSLVVSEGRTMEDRLSYLSVTTPFYDESERHVGFAFGLTGFRIIVVPYIPLGSVILEEFSDHHIVQLLSDRRGPGIPKGGIVVHPPFTRPDAGVLRRLFSAGGNVLFFVSGEVRDELREAFIRETAGAAEARELIRKGLQILNAETVLLMEEEQWMMALKEKQRRKEMIDALLMMAGRRVLKKGGIDRRLGRFSIADEILEAGERRWTITASREEANVRLEGTSIRLDDWEEANWFLRTVDTMPAGG